MLHLLETMKPMSVQRMEDFTKKDSAASLDFCMPEQTCVQPSFSSLSPQEMDGWVTNEQTKIYSLLKRCFNWALIGWVMNEWLNEWTNAFVAGLCLSTDAWTSGLVKEKSCSVRFWGKDTLYKYHLDVRHNLEINHCILTAMVPWMRAFQFRDNSLKKKCSHDKERLL